MSTPNHFLQASRSVARLDPAGFLRWLLGSAGERYRFHGWLDTTAFPLPGTAQDALVAELVERSVVGLHWALTLEFQSEPDAELFGRLLEYQGRLWRELRPTDQPQQRFQVAAAVVNLTGTSGRSSRVMNLCEGVRTGLEVREIHLATLEAMPFLEAIAQGKHSPALLPWIPLLRGGGEPDTIARWKTFVALEPDEQRRGEYLRLVLIFADLTDAHAAWKAALQEGAAPPSAPPSAPPQAETAADKAARLITLLESRFKKIPGTVTTRLKATADLAQLDEWLQAASTVSSLAEFRKLLKGKEG